MHKSITSSVFAVFLLAATVLVFSSCSESPITDESPASEVQVDISDVPAPLPEEVDPETATQSPAAPKVYGLKVRSWRNQRGGDLYNAGNDILQYSKLEDGIKDAGHNVLPGVWSLTYGNLHDVDVFFHGTGGPNIKWSDAQKKAARNANRRGTCFIIEANSDSGEQASGQALVDALKSYRPVPTYTGVVGGDQGSYVGRFVGSANSSKGPFGNLVGASFGSSLTADVEPGSGRLVGTNDDVRAWVDWHPCPSCGAVMVVGDPYGFNLFQHPASFSYNANNQKAYLNFIENCAIRSR